MNTYLPDRQRDAIRGYADRVAAREAADRYAGSPVGQALRRRADQLDRLAAGQPAAN